MTIFREAMRRIIALADQLSGLLLIAICLLNCVAVYKRYILLDSISWSEEAIRYLAVWMTFLGVASASWLDEHMDMNLFTEFAGETFQKWHRAFLHLLAVAFGGIVLWQGSIYTWLNGRQTSPSLGVEMMFIYSAIWIGGLLIVLVSLVKIWDCFVPPPAEKTGIASLS